MKNLYTESSYDRNERPKEFPFYQNYQENTYFAPDQGTEKNLLFDPKGISESINWGVKPLFTNAPTEPEARTMNQVLALNFANVLHNSLVLGGQDPSQGLILRQLIGQAAMQPVQVADEDINDEGISREQTKLNDLMTQPEDRLKQEGMGDLITQSMSKIAYMKARYNNTLVVPDNNIANYYRGQGIFGQIVGSIADMLMTVYDSALEYNPASVTNFSLTTVPAQYRMAGDGLRVLRSMGFDNDDVLVDLEKETGSLPSTSTADMVALVESFDSRFDYKTWFNEKIAMDPLVRGGLLNYGVTEDLFKQSRNSTHALMTLMSIMDTTDIQRRLSNYAPSTWQHLTGMAAEFKDGMIGNIDIIAQTAISIGATIAIDLALGAAYGAAATPEIAGVGAVPGAAVGTVVGIGESIGIVARTFSTSKKIIASGWYLTGLGKLPRFAMQWGVVRTTVAHGLVASGFMANINYFGQKENIALANSLYYYNPNMKSTFSNSELLESAESGFVFGATLGFAGHVLSTGIISFKNYQARLAYYEHGLPPEFAPQLRNPFQTTLENINKFRNRKTVSIQDPIAGAIHTAISKGNEPTVVDINSAARTTSTAIDAASVASNPKDAANLPDHSLNLRQPNEPMKAFTIRAVLGKFVTSITDLLDADSVGGRFSQLTPREQYLTLLRTEDHMRDFSTMTDIETDLNNKVAGRPEQVRIIDPVTGRSSSPAANVAKLYGELDAAKSTLDKTISKEDRAEAIAAHKNGTELAPRTISGAVDKATANARGIMENASEGRHNPSEAKGPKVDTEATTGVPTEENAAQGTTAPALPTQKKVDEITQDTAEDMSLLTNEELEDPKVTGAIERNVTRQLFGGQKEHTLRSLSRGLAKARKLTIEQQGKITATLDSPRAFLKTATGNKTYINNFYNRLDQLVTLGHITDVDRRIILASTVNTVFTSNIAAKISDIGIRGDNRASTSLQGDIKIGKLDTSVAGNTRVENVLHEIGHVEELHAHGQSLMDMRKLFTSEQAFLDAAQEVLGTDNFNKYYLAGNTQELMSQVKAKMMIDEVRLAAFLKTAGSTAVEKTLLQRFLSVGTTLVEVFNSLKLSKVDAEDEMYMAVKNVLSQLEKNSGPLMTRVHYHNRVAGALKEFPKGKLSSTDKVTFTKTINAKISEGFSKVDMVGQNMLFLATEVESLHALTAHSDGSIDPIRLDAYLNVKREGITVKSKEKFVKTFQSYVEINQRYLASTTDIYIASMKENGYKAVPSNPIVMDAFLSKRDQIAALREYHSNLSPDEMVVTPSYLDPTFGNFNGELALQFLIDSSTEPTVMFAPMEGFVSKLKTMVGINNDTLESIVGGVEIDPKHMGKALQMLNVDKMITIEQIKVKLAAAEMVVALNPFCVEQLSTMKSKVKAGDLGTTQANSLTSWIEKTVLNLSVGKRDEAMKSLSSVLFDLELRINREFRNSKKVTPEGRTYFDQTQPPALYNTKTIEAVVKETKQWAADLQLINSNRYAPTKPENVIMEVTFGASAVDRKSKQFPTSLSGQKGTWQKVLGTDVDVEGKKMDHCILKYKESVDSGRTDVYSLRDENNEPVATVGIKFDGRVVFDASQHGNQQFDGMVPEVKALLEKLNVTQFTYGGTVARHAEELGITAFDQAADKVKRELIKRAKNPNWEKELTDAFSRDLAKTKGQTTELQTNYILENINDFNASPVVNRLLESYVSSTGSLPMLLREQNTLNNWYMRKFAGPYGALPEAGSFGDSELIKALAWVGNKKRSEINPLFIDISYGYNRVSDINFSRSSFRGTTNAIEDKVWATLQDVSQAEQRLPKFFQTVVDRTEEFGNAAQTQKNLFKRIANIDIELQKLPVVSYYNGLVKYMETYSAKLKDTEARLEKDRSIRAAHAGGEDTFYLDQIIADQDKLKDGLKEFITFSRLQAIAQMKPVFGWGAKAAFEYQIISGRQAKNTVYFPRNDSSEVNLLAYQNQPDYKAFETAQKATKQTLTSIKVAEQSRIADAYDAMRLSEMTHAQKFMLQDRLLNDQFEADLANDLFAPTVRQTPATKQQAEFVKDSVVTIALRHSSTLPNGIKFGLDGGESSLGAGVYLSSVLGDPRNYPTDVYVNITKPLVVDTAAYIQAMPVDPRLGYIPFSSTANVFNHHISMLMQQFISEKGLVVDPRWMQNLAENMVQPMRDIPQVVKEALDLTDGQWHKSYSRAGVDQSISSTILDDSVLLQAGDDQARQQAIIAQHNNDSSVTVSNVAEARIIAHRLMQRMGYDGVVAKNFQSFDYNGKALLQGKDMYVVLDTKAIMPKEEMFAPQARPQVTKWAQDKFGDRKAPDGSLVSENFIRWFGDSEVVDADGNPQLVYHGTRNKFTQFMEQDATRLSYFSTEFSFSKRWANSKMGEEVFNPTPAEQKLIAETNFKANETIRLAFEKLRKQGVLSNMSAAERNDVLSLGTEVERSLLNGETLQEFKYKISERGLYSPPVVLGVYIKAENIFNPTTMWQEFMPKFEEVLQRKRDRQIANGDFEGRTDPLIDKQTLEDIKSGTYYMWEMPEIVDAVFKKYDAIRLHEPTSMASFAKEPLSTIAIRDSWRVKSATDNSGSFDANSPDIMFAPRAKPSVAYTPELVVQRLAFLSTNLKDAPATAADFKKAMQGMLGLDDALFDALSAVKGTVNPEQMAGYHQMVIKRVVDALMSEKIAVGPNGVRRLNSVEREMNLVRASKQTEGTKAAKLERARTEPVEDMPADTTDSKLYPNNPMTATMLENFWQDSTTFKQVAARLKASSSLNDQGVLDAISDAMLKVKAKGVAILVDAKGEVRSRNALINYIVVSAKNANLDAKGLKVSRAGLTPDSWKDFLETENDILRSSGEEEITFNGTPTQHIAAEKKKGSELYARFKKAYAKSYIEGGEDGAVTGATYTQATEPKVSQVKAEGLSTMVDYATRLEYNLYSTRDGGWQKFVVTNLMDGKSYAEIVALAKENAFPNKKAGNVADAIDAVRSKFKKMLEEKTGVSLKDMSNDEVMASGVLDSIEEQAKAADAARETAPEEDLAPERKSSSEILAETEKSATEQTNSDELTAALDTKEPTSQPVIAPEGSKGPVTAVVQVDGEAVGPLTPHVAPKTAEAVVKGSKTPKARFTSSTPKKVVVFTTGDARAMLKATGNVGKLFFTSMKTMEGLLNALPKSALKDTDIAAVVKILKKMVAAGEEKEAVAKFLALMKHLDIEAVKIIDPKDGRTVMNFIFAEQAWSYGGISRFKATPKKAKPAAKTAEPKTAAPKTAEPKTAEPKTAEPKTAEAAPQEAAPVDTPTEAAPDGTQVPVMEPKEVPSNEIAGGSVIPVISEHDRIVTGLTEGNEALRDGGVDATSFTALFKKFVRSLSKDAKKKLGNVLPEEFKDLFMKFVELNAAIMHDNRTIFRSSKIVQKFWAQVDIISALEDGLKMKDQMHIRLTMKEIYAMAAAQISTREQRFLPPLTHENITIKNGKFGLRDVSKETQGVLARRDTGPIVEYTPEELAARKAAADAAAPAGPIGSVTTEAKKKGPLTVKEIHAEGFNKEGDQTVAAEAEIVLTNDDRINNIVKRISASFSQLLRQNNLVSWLIGGSERSNRNRWRTFMSKVVNGIQHAAKLGSTVRSMNAELRFIAMFMDDSRAMTGQLVSPEGVPVRSAAKSKQEAVMFTSNLTRIHHALSAEAAVLKLSPAERKLLQRLQIEAWQKKTSPTSKEMSATFGNKDFTKIADILENYRKEILHLNTEMLKLEEKTEWRTVTKNGKPVEADVYLPIQLHIQKLMAAMADNKQYDKLLRSIIATRRATKMADEKLDRNTLISMGIMNLEDNSTFYTQDRKFAVTNNVALDADTLKKLYDRTITTTESMDFTKTLGENGRDFFIVQEGGNRVKVYKMPTSIKDLSDVDLKKYYDTVSGDQTNVTKVWKDEFNNKELIEVEMKELLDFKSRQGRYHHTKNSMVNNRPVIDANHYDEAFSTVRNFSVEELISDKDLFNVARTDLHAAYQNFSRYRMFDLLFQESLDQLAGSKGLRPKEFFRLLEARIKKNADEVSKGMSPDSRAAIQKDIDDGMGRLVWQYADYNGTISHYGAESRVGQNIARTIRGLATTASGIGYGLAQSPETTMEIIKNMPQTKGLSVPVGGFRYLVSLLKFWDRKDSATKMQVGDLITSLEEYSKDHSTHFNEGIADIDFDTDLNAPYRAIWNSGKNSEGMTGQIADFFSRTGQTTVLAGGVMDGTNLARLYGKARHVRDLTGMMRDGKLKEFLRLRALPENRAAMQKLLEGSFTSAAEERKLWKMHKSIARQAGGLDPFLALKAIKVGLDSPAKLEAMMYGMNAANALDGILDFRDLHMVYRDLKNMKDPPIDPELYRAAATDFQYGVEALIRKRTVTHGFGLNKNLSVFNTQDEVGKLVNTLTSYMRSWFDDVALNAPERGATGLMFGGILSVAVLETVISLLREWMSGREMDDMVAELEQDPMEYVLRVATRMPIFGAFSPVFEGLLKTTKYMAGGAQKGGQGFLDTISQIGGGSPNIGINSAMSLLKTTGEAGSDLVTGAMEGDTQLMAKGALRVPGHFFNKSIYAMPVRIMEEEMDLDDQHVAQFIIDGLQKKPYRFLSQQRGGRRGGSSRAAPQSPVASPVTTQTMPSSAALRNAQRPGTGRQVKEYVAPAPPSKPNSGVSERLGKLLDNPSYTPTPPM